MTKTAPRQPDRAPADDPLACLRAFDRLEVGPVRLETRRLVAPYQVVRGADTETTELSYRFEEDVFDPERAEDQNLATLIAAQLALNYGLFCDEIVIHGPVDRADQRFLQDMAANTAREILVKKFLQDNPFIVGEAAALEPVRRESYLRARLVFPGLLPAGTALRSAPLRWGTAPQRCAVLSSGGKDSLLSYGLLDEIGCEVHSIFLNESGRHWFTALNAYRHFSQQVPHSARVWTNSDRVFAWMLRRLPFVRPDFAELRADDYPVRLWTVAVFLFGALPLLRKRGIGRLVIGDEYDTTRRVKHAGITHYDGLYDQSRYFDNALSRYFTRKGWGVEQYSLLRPLSEFSIQTLLAKRYPELQALQVSCHAAHKGAQRIEPCGRCEKCRRIVAMLLAADQDPARCGYTPQQVNDCVHALERQQLHQESEGAQHLVHLLGERGLLTAETVAKLRGRERPEVTRLRFDPERAPLDWIPDDLRGPLLDIFLADGRGAVHRQGRRWVEFDPRSNTAALTAQPLDPQAAAAPPREQTGGSDEPYLLGHWTWPEAQKRLKTVDVALLPVGAIEQHGPHLPLDTDAYDADHLARQVASGCGSPQPLVLPLIPYGVSYHHDDFAGTLSIAPETLAQLVYEVGVAAARQGVQKLIIINGHGGNGPALHFAAQKINRDARIFTAVDSGETSDTDIDAIVETENDVHAGEIETSTALATRPELVQMARALRHSPRFSSRYLNFSSRRGVGWYARIEKLSPRGVLGDPTKATADKGQRIWEVMIQNLVEFVEDLQGLSLDELYQRRY